MLLNELAPALFLYIGISMISAIFSFVDKGRFGVDNIKDYFAMAAIVIGIILIVYIILGINGVFA